MCFVKPFHSLRSCDNKHAFNILSTMLFDKVNGCHCRTACGKHRIYQNDLSLLNRIRKLAVIFVRLMSHRITIKSNMTDLCRWDKRCDAIYHPKACTKYRYNCQLLARDHRRLTCLNRGFNRNVLQRKITKCFISHQDSNLFDQLTELICSCIFIADNRNLVLDQRVIHNKYVLHFLCFTSMVLSGTAPLAAVHCLGNTDKILPHFSYKVNHCKILPYPL